MLGAARWSRAKGSWACIWTTSWTYIHQKEQGRLSFLRRLKSLTLEGDAGDVLPVSDHQVTYPMLQSAGVALSQRRRVNWENTGRVDRLVNKESLVVGQDVNTPNINGKIGKSNIHGISAMLTDVLWRTCNMLVFVAGVQRRAEPGYDSNWGLLCGYVTDLSSFYPAFRPSLIKTLKQTHKIRLI